MLVQNDKTFARFLCQLFDSLTQFPIFTGKSFDAETPKFSEHRRFNENKHSVKQSPPAKSRIQNGHHQFSKEIFLIPANGRAAGHAIAGADFFHHVDEQFRAGMGIRVHKDQPVAGRRRRTGISRAGDLVDRFKHNGCSRRPCNFRRPVMGIIVTDDQFAFPVSLCECAARRLDLSECFGQKFFLIEGRDNDGNFHHESVAILVRCSNLKVYADKFSSTRRQPDDFTQRRARTKLHKAFELLHQRLAPPHIIKPRRTCRAGALGRRRIGFGIRHELNLRF